MSSKLPPTTIVLPRLPQPKQGLFTLPEGAKQIDPGVLLITLLDDMTRTLESMRDIEGRMAKALTSIEANMELVPKGVAETFDGISVTSTAEAVFDTVKETEQLWFSATVYNEGPDSVQVRANDGDPSERAWIRAQRKSRYLTLDLGESMDVDFKSPKLRYIYYRLAPSSASAVIKIVGEW